MLTLRNINGGPIKPFRRNALHVAIAFKIKTDKTIEMERNQ
jgi:hypothetical protein